MSASVITPHIAPRTIEGVRGLSALTLRSLVSSCGGLNTPAQKMAYHSLQTHEARADYVLKCLHEWDAANPGAAAPSNGAPTGVAVPVQPVPASSLAPQVAQVSPQAAQAAQQAAADRPRRSPRTSTPEASPTTPSAPADLGSEVIRLLQQVLKETETNTECYRAIEKAAAASQAGSDKRLAELSQQVANLAQVQTWTLTAFLTFASETLKVPVSDILGVAIGDSDNFQQLVRNATGKA